MSELRVRILRHIDEVEPAEWDSIIAEDDLQATHRFVKACQDSKVEDAEYRHVLVYEGQRLLGVASTSVMHVSLDVLATGVTRRVIRWIRSKAPGFLRLPVLFCGLPVSFGNSCLRFAPGADPAPVIRAVAAEMEDFAHSAGVGLLCFKEFSPPFAPLLTPLAGHGYFQAPSIPFCSLRVPWRSFDDYLASMRTSYRRQIRASLRLGQAQGIQLRYVDDFEEHCPAIFSLYEQVMERAPYQLERLNLEFLRRLNAYLGAQSRALLVERDGRLLAAAILLYSPRALTFLIAGIDYALNREHAAYLNLVTELVAEAIRAGKSELELGQTSYRLKGRMGAYTTERDLYIHHRTPLWHGLMQASSRLLFPVQQMPPRRVFK